MQVGIEGSDGGQMAGERAGAMPGLREGTLEVRKGVAPGSFIDLLMRSKDRTTGQGFTDLEIANQVEPALLSSYSTYDAPQRPLIT